MAFVVLALLATAAPSVEAAPGALGANGRATVTATRTSGAPSLTISLITTPATGQDFSFDGCQVGGGCAPFTLDDDTDPTHPSTLSAMLSAGTYTVTQDAVPGWTLEDLHCTGSATVDVQLRRATIQLDGTHPVSCEFTDTSPSITVEMGVSPSSSRAFAFTGCLGSACADFTLDGRPGDPAQPTSITAAVAPGTYTVTQTDTPNWYVNSISCTSETVDLPNRRVTIVVEPGEQVRCRFAIVGRRITIHQVSRPDDPQDFVYTGCRNETACGGFTLDDDTDPAVSDSYVADDLPDGTYTVTQAMVPNWRIPTLSCTSGGTTSPADRTVTIEMVANVGAVVDCTFTNATTSITIVENARPDDPQDFAFTGCQGSACASFTLDDDQDPTLPRSLSATGLAPGTYTVTQADVPGWPLRNLTCPGEPIDLEQRQVTITLTANEQRTCTFTNQQSGISVRQDTEPDGPQDFTFQTCHQGTGCDTVSLDDDADAALASSVTTTSAPTGTYWITQAPTPGYTRPRLSCDGATPFANGAFFTFDGTDAVSCTFTNEVAGPPFEDATDVTTGYGDVCGRTTSGGVRCWGGALSGGRAPLATIVVDDAGQPVADIAQVAAGTKSFCILGATGRVRCWGANGFGQLGDGTTDTRTQPASTSDPHGTVLTGATQVSVGYAHACAVLRSGQARCWGSNAGGKLGDGTTTDRSRPVVVTNPDGNGPLTGVVQIAAGGRHTCARLDDGQVRCWGAGALGNGSSVRSGNSLRPVAVSNPDGTGPLDGVVQVVTSSATNTNTGHDCALRVSGDVVCWGWGGAVGDGTGLDRTRPIPVLDGAGDAPLSLVTGLTAGWYHTCARLADGQARCWGSGGIGQLGNNTTQGSLLPVVVTGPDGTGALDEVNSIGGGQDYTCATQADGAASCWGLATFGSLGTGSDLPWSYPVAVLTAP